MAVLVATGAVPAADDPRPTVVEARSPSIVGARADCSARTTCTLSWELARLPVTVYAGADPERIDRSEPVAVVRTGDTVTVDNPDPGAPRYFELVAEGRGRGPILGDRFLGLTGSPDSRDLGGYLTTDGKRTRWGRLFRSDGLEALDDADRTRLVTVGLPSECPEPFGVSPPTDATLGALAAAVTSPAARARDRALLLRLARDPAPQWVQCDLVADRLGWPAALVLTTLGVGRETVVADHLTGARSGGPPARVRRYVDIALEAVRTRYRSWDRYLDEGLGLDRRTTDRLRVRYVTDR